MVTYRKAQRSDYEAIVTILTQAISFLAEQGVDQWQNGTVFVDTIAKAIEQPQSYVWEENQQVIAFVLLENEDPFYEQLTSGQWCYFGPFFAIHRVMIHAAYRGKGLMKKIFNDIKQIAQENEITILRIDTHQDNKAMQAAIKSAGFTYCGTTIVGDGNLRLVFEKKYSSYSLDVL